jgi:hypothetical protein
MSDSKNASKKPSAGKLTGRLSEEEIKKIFLICIPPYLPHRLTSKPADAIIASTPPAPRPARPISTSRSSLNESNAAMSKARPTRSWSKTLWALCVPACARPKSCAKKRVFATATKTNRSRSGYCSGTQPTTSSKKSAFFRAQALHRQDDCRHRRRAGRTFVCPPTVVIRT